MICTVACQESEVVKFRSLVRSTFFLFSIMSTRPQQAIYQKIIIKFGVPDFQNKRQISYHHGSLLTVIISFINNKTRFTYFNPLIPGRSKRSNSQISSQKLLFILIMYDLLLPPDIEC